MPSQLYDKLEAAERRAVSLEFELQALEHYRVKGNEELLRRIEAAERRAARLEQALRELLANPYGCPFCDSGKMRTPNNPTKDHDSDCPFVVARAALSPEAALAETEEQG